jgi:hypothetical protein
MIKSPEEGGIRVPQRYGDLDDATPRALRVAKGAVAGLCVATALAHATLVFLHVAPPNPVSQRLHGPIRAWIYPFFEQNWLLFAPNPNTDNTRIFARTGRTAENGDREVSDWVEISAVDDADTRHNPYPSRTTQSMLRRAWSAYMSAHGEDEVSRDEWALIQAEYLRNIAVRRMTGHGRPPFETIRLKVVVEPIAPPAGSAAAQSGPTEPYTRTLPWWNATSDGS